MNITIDNLNKEDRDRVLGQGFGFPVELSDDGSIKIVSGPSHVSQSVGHLCLYNQGNYPGVFSLGGNISGLPFKPNSLNVATKIIDSCKKTIELFEERVDTFDVVLKRVPEKPTEVDIFSSYNLSKINEDDKMKLNLEWGDN